MSGNSTDILPFPPPAQRKRLAAIGLFLILLLALVLRVHGLTRHSLWSDEIYTLESSSGRGLESKQLTFQGVVDHAPDLLAIDASHPWWMVATSLARDDNHPPLYFILVREWRELFGDSDAALRSLSVIFSLAAIVFLFDMVDHLHGTAPALWAAVLMAVAGPQIQFAQEGRAYALATLLSLAACAALVRIEICGPNRWRLITLGSCVLAMMLTHYYAIAPGAAMGCYAMVQLRGRARRDVALALILAGAAFAAMWGWALLRQRGNVAGNNFYIIEPEESHVANLLERLLLMPARCLSEVALRSERPAALGALLYVVPWFLVLRGQRRWLLWALWLGIPVAMVACVDIANRSKQLEFLRYTVLASPAVYAMLASLLAPMKGWLRHALPASGVIACIAGLPITYEVPAVPKPDWRPMAAMIQKYARPDDIMYFKEHHPNDPGIAPNQYLTLLHYTSATPRTVIFTDQAPEGAVLERLRRAHAVWIVAPMDQLIPADQMPGLVPGERGFVFGLPIVQRWVPADTQGAGH